MSPKILANTIWIRCMSVKGMFLEKKYNLNLTLDSFEIFIAMSKTFVRFIKKDWVFGQRRNEPYTYTNPTYLNFDKSSQYEEIIIEFFSRTCIFKPICTRKCTSMGRGKLRCLRFIT